MPEDSYKQLCEDMLKAIIPQQSLDFLNRFESMTDKTASVNPVADKKERILPSGNMPSSALDLSSSIRRADPLQGEGDFMPQRQTADEDLF